MLDYLPAQKKLMEAVAKDQPLVARKALFALLHLARPTRHGKHGEPSGNRVNLQEIANLGKSAVPYLIEAIRQVDDPDYTLPYTCQILGMIGDRRAIPALVAVVDRDKGFGFWMAAEGLDKFDDPSLLPVFARNVHKKLPDYGTITDAYLFKNGEIGRQVAEDALATNDDPEVRRSLTWVLAGFEDYRSAPALRHALNDPDKDVRAGAQYALQKIYAARKKRPHTPTSFGL